MVRWGEERERGENGRERGGVGKVKEGLRNWGIEGWRHDGNGKEIFGK
jgi:hypothetical protein